MELPDSLTRKIDLWRAKARSFRDEAELFPTTSWVAVMLGQGILPEAYDPIADALDEEKVAGALQQIREAIRQTAERLPSHGEFIAQITNQRPPKPELPEFVF
jgi:tryptophan halogenase